MSVLTFISISVIIALVDVFVLILSARERDRDGRLLAVCLFFCLFVDVFYMASVLVSDYFAMSAFSSAYFICVDLVLLALISFLFSFCDLWNRRARRVLMGVFGILCLIDIVALALNPAFELSLTYTYDAASMAHWRYAPYAGYTCHLVLCYIMVAMCFAILIYRAATIPRAYRGRFLTLLFGLFFTVMVNATFLFIPANISLDYSLVFYSVLGIYIYVVAFKDHGKATLAATHDMVLSQLGRGVILFDPENRFAVCNAEGQKFVAPEHRNRHYLLPDFLGDLGLADTVTDLDIDWALRRRFEVDGVLKPYRFDLRVMRDDRGRELGRLVVMVDNSFLIDMITGFHTKTAFEREFHGEAEFAHEFPTTVCVCDLNHLADLNKRLGRETGDEAVKALADAMTARLPKGSFFARYDDANLVAVCVGVDLSTVQDDLKLVAEDVRACTFGGVPLDMQSAAAVVSEANPSIVDATNTALSAMKLRKMLDFDSAHSSLLASLAMTQRQSDGETEEHVRRTRAVADRLAERLGLSDWDKSSLALLCLLHDIGKVGVPLEILNKPTKLTDAEWEVLKSHTQKGYEIASASDELRGIADGILHHHERWDGAGYPDGLARESIPLLSRVVAVVDTYDAMTHDRPYRRALSRQQALEELRRCAGSQFDPTVVAEFLDMVDEGLDSSPDLAADAAYCDAAQDEQAGVKDGLLEVSRASRVSDSSRELFKSGRADDLDLRLGTIRYGRYTLDADQHILSVFGAFEEMTGYSAQDVKDYNLSQGDLLFPEDSEEYWAIVGEQLALNGEAYLDHRLRCKDGSSLSVFCYGSVFFDSAERREKSQIVIADVTSASSVKNVMNKARVSALHNVKKWEDRASRDDVTGLLNREAYRSEVQMRLLDDDCDVVLLMLDLDKFKQFNDGYGHLEGDRLLMFAAHAFEQAAGKDSLVSRMGGDEFSAALFFEPGTALEVVSKRVDDLWSQVSNALQGYKQGVTISLGAARLDDADATFRQLYGAADQELYKAKNAGRARYSCNWK